MLGIIIGVAAVISLVSVGRGVENFVAAEFQGLGNNLLFVMPGQIAPDQRPRRGGLGLTNDDVAAIATRSACPMCWRWCRNTAVRRSFTTAVTKSEPPSPARRPISPTCVTSGR
jgi:hypothetical protein